MYRWTGRCTFRRDTLGPSRWRKPIRAGSVIFPQASQAALFILYAYGIISLFSALTAWIVDVNWPSQANEQRGLGRGDKNEAEIDRCRFRFDSACLSISPRSGRVLSCRSRVEWFELRRQCIEGERKRGRGDEEGGGDY